MKRHRFSLSSCLVPALSLGIAAGADATSGGDASGGVSGTLTIYSSLPLQGDSQPQSEDIVRAIELSLEEHGGRAGNNTIEYVSLDDATAEAGFWDADQVEANARKAAADDTTIAYIGEFNSPASRISIPILNEAGILQVSPSNTHVGLTRSEGAETGEPDIYYPTGERTYGRVIPTDYVQAPALASYMNDQGCTSVYILNDEETYGFDPGSDTTRSSSPTPPSRPTSTPSRGRPSSRRSNPRTATSPSRTRSTGTRRDLYDAMARGDGPQP